MFTVGQKRLQRLAGPEFLRFDQEEEVERMKVIEFIDQADQGKGIVIIQATDDEVRFCISLEEDGDIEVFLHRDVAFQIIEELESALNNGVDS